MRLRKKTIAAFGLVEIIIAIAIISISLFALSNAANLAFLFIEETTREGRVSFLLEEGLEAVRILRDLSWAENIAPLASDTPYYPIFNVGWSLVGSDPGPIDGIFTRSVIFEDVYRRDSDYDIVDIGAPDPKTLDPETKKVTASVTWVSTNNKISTRTLATYITNLFQN